MSGQLKDIVEDGFARLESLAAKRKSILKQVDELAEKASQKQLELADTQMAELESQIASHMERQTKRLQDELNASLEGVLNREKEYVKNSISNMASRMKAALAELKHSQKNFEQNALDRLASSFAELNVESEFSRKMLDAEIERFLSELNSLSLENQSLFRSAESDAKRSLSVEFDRSTEELNKRSQAVAQQFFEKTREANESISEASKLQIAKWVTLTEKPARVISQLLKEEFQKIKEQIEEEQVAIKFSHERLLGSSTERLSDSAGKMNEQLLSEFEASYSAVSGRLDELKQLSAELLEQQKASLLDQDSDVKRQVYRVYFDLITSSERAPNERSNLDKALAELSKELTLLADDLRIRWSEIRKIQEEQIKALSQSASNSLLALQAEGKAKVNDLIEQKERETIKQEDELLQHMASVEKKIKRKIAMQSNPSGGTAS